MRPKHVAAIGYCFGGTCVLELARSGANVAGVVSFHGGLATDNPADARTSAARCWCCTAATTRTFRPRKSRALEDEMRSAGVEWQLVVYGGAVHAFTNPGAGNDKSRGAAYDAAADRRSWEAMKGFFGEIL